jgi:hypothetical protein
MKQGGKRFNKKTYEFRWNARIDGMMFARLQPRRGLSTADQEIEL